LGHNTLLTNKYVAPAVELLIFCSNALRSTDHFTPTCARRVAAAGEPLGDPQDYVSKRAIAKERRVLSSIESGEPNNFRAPRKIASSANL
jgi:hypothetical protein